MEFKIGFSIAALIFLTIGIPFYIFSNVQSQKLKFISLAYYILCIFITIFISMHFYKNAHEIFQIPLKLTGFISILSLPIAFVLSWSVKKNENLTFSDLKKVAILLPYIYAIAPVLAASLSYIFIALFNSEIAFGITLGGGYLSSVMWLPASIFLIIFIAFVYAKNRKSIGPISKTPATSE